MKLSIAFWNVTGNRINTEQALRDSGEFDIVAVQEPEINRSTKSVYCNDRYYRVYDSGRTALYIHRRHSIAAWTQKAGTDWCYITFREGDEVLTVWSIYSEQYTGGNWRSPIPELVTLSIPGRYVLVGDFNLHHPAWDKEERTSAKADELLALVQRWRLELTIPWGTVTRFRHDHRDSTIDLAWATDGLNITYKGDLGYAGSDHLAQLIIVEDSTIPQNPVQAPPGWSWTLIDRNAAAAAAAHLTIPNDLSTPDTLDQAVDILISQLQGIADYTTPKRKIRYSKAARWWTKTVQDILTDTKRAQKTFRRSLSAYTYEALQGAK